MMNLTKKAIFFLFVVTLTFSCWKPSKEEMSSAFIKNYIEIASASYRDTYNSAFRMRESIASFLESPNEENLKAAKDAWIYARNFYGQTEAFRESDGPIDNGKLLNKESKINAYPLDASYIDYVKYGIDKDMHQKGGLISDDSFVISEENLLDKNEWGGEANISTGWHVIEFLLWGEDLNGSNGKDFNNKGGQRPVTDYTTDALAVRRKMYLMTVTNLLIKHLKELKEVWDEGGSYRMIFSNLGYKKQLRNILNGLAVISSVEIAGERLDDSIEGGQEYEHSRFSDNTIQDLEANIYGLNNIIVGRYKKEEGSIISDFSLIDFIANIDHSLSKRLKEAADNSLSKLKDLMNEGKNFDEIVENEVLESKGVAGRLAEAMRHQGLVIFEIANKLRMEIYIVVQ